MSDIELQPGQDQLITHAKGGLKLSYNRERTRVRVTAPGVPPVEPPPVTGRVVQSGENIDALMAAGHTDLKLRTGPHKFARGSQPTTYPGVSLMPYPGDAPYIDCGGAQNMAYLVGTTWRIGVEVRNVAPGDNGAIGVGKNARLESIKGFKLTGPGGTSSKAHGVYLYGENSSAKLDEPDITGFSGSALQTYLPSGINKAEYPIVEVNGGRLHGGTVAVYAYSGPTKLTNVELSGKNVEVDTQSPGKTIASGCKRPDGSAARIPPAHA